MALAIIEGSNSQISAYNEFRSQLAELRKLNSATVFDYETPRGNRDARSHVHTLRKSKAAVEKVRVREKAESLAYGRRVDEQAKEIVTEIEAMIEVHAKPLQEIEDREKARVSAIEGRIAAMRQLAAGDDPLTHTLYNSSVLKANLAAVKATVIDESFEEFQGDAAKAKDVAITTLDALIIDAEKREAEAAELERLRKESEDRKRQEYEDRIRKEAIEAAAQEAERKAKLERERVAREAEEQRLAGERREMELKLAAEKAQREKAEAEERAVRAAKEAEERVRREAEEKAKLEAAEAEKREANEKHRAAVNNEAVSALVRGGMTEDMAKLAVPLIAQKAVPHITISY